uniref:Acetylcholinesterase n=1 Tax=Strongyloides venezuelensis TaxID=75913 RepID=A0A0K0F528_STRVS
MYYLSFQTFFIFSLLNSAISGLLNYKPAGVYNIENNTVTEYLGIPYAKPPTGKLRFMPPEEIDELKENKTFEAKYPAATCPQFIPPNIFPYNFSGFSVWYPPRNISEDCLQLNLWQPEKTTGGVIVMIHGGAYYSLSASLDIFNGSVLAAVARSVVVTINYRIGALGFARWKDGKNITGNMGLLDQQMALKWINQNIHLFGGKKDKVTLIGEHAGSSSAVAHLFAEGSKNFFSKIITASGTLENIWATQPNEYIENSTVLLAKNLSCADKTDVLSCLQNISDPMAFVNSSNIVRRQMGLSFGFPFAITQHDGKFFKTNISDMSIDKDMKKNFSIMLGDTGNEGSFFLYNYFGKFGCTINFTNVEDPSHQCLINNTAFENITQIITNVLGKDEEWRKKLQDQYGYNKDSNEDKVKNRNMLSKIMSDILFDCGLKRFAEQIVNTTSSKVYYYIYNYTFSSNPWPKWMGAVHASSMEAVFGYPYRYPQLYSSALIEKDKNISSYIMKIYGNFSSGTTLYSELYEYNRTSKNVGVLDSMLTGPFPKYYINDSYTQKCDLFSPYILKPKINETISKK